MTEVKSILFVGVGGQGTILVSKILTQGLLNKGYDVKMSEIHGMSQRGGSVSTQVRYGKKVYSPVIGEGEADLLVSFEEMETYRWLAFLKPTGKVILNTFRILSAPMLSGQADYPGDLKEEISSKADTIYINAMDIAVENGEAKYMNLVLLGALIKELGLEDIAWERIIGELVKPQFLQGNISAMEQGIAHMKTQKTRE
jgi:indolepyruvate ferredoxin oxidoreductase beta subunit